MSLKLIPVEEKAAGGAGKKQKHFNPGNKIKSTGDTDFSLKTLCLRIVHFINRGSRFTYQQIDDLIMVLHRMILKLQKRKEEMAKKKA